MRYAALFCDLGGVALTNGWDRRERAAAARRFDIDPAELEARHAAIAGDFECGRLPLGDYLKTVFLANPGSPRAHAVEAFMREQSQAYPGALAVLERIGKADPSLLLAALNNESAELNRHRIEAFQLRRYFQLFFSSCYLGVRKPDQRIYRLALAITQLAPAACLVIDDRQENLDAAARLGMPTLRIDTPGDLSGLQVRLESTALESTALL